MKSLLAVFAVLALVACSDSPDNLAVPKMSLERQLATLDKTDGSVPTQNAPEVERYKVALDQLSVKFPETPPAAIADYGQRAQQAILVKGVRVSILEVIEATNAAVTAATNGLAYKDIATMYATLRAQGLNQEQAIKSLKEYVPRSEKLKAA